jgi:t-SNARE complex subunit (syntaxin)
MNETEMEHRLTEVEARSKSNTHRIDKLERVTEEIHTMSNTMIQLVEEVKHTNETVSSLDQKVEKMDGRVDDMERAPGKEWSNAKRTVFNTVVGAVIGFLIAGLMWAAVQAFLL